MRHSSLDTQNVIQRRDKRRRVVVVIGERAPLVLFEVHPLVLGLERCNFVARVLVLERHEMSVYPAEHRKEIF